MQKLILVFLFFSYLSFSQGQNLISSEEIDLKHLNNKNNQESIAMVDSTSQNVLFAVTDNKSINFIYYDSSYNKLMDKRFKKPNKLFDKVMGYSIEDSAYNLYVSNQKLTVFSVISVHKETYAVTYNEFKVDLGGDSESQSEYFLNGFNNNHHFYMLTYKSFEETISVYEFNNKNDYTKNSFAFNQYEIRTKTGYRLNQIFDHLGPDSNGFGVKKISQKALFIENNSINSIEAVSEKNKMYCYNDRVFITLDFNRSKTHLITIDLLGKEASYKTISNLGGDKKVKSNSFLFENNIYQIATNPDDFIISVTNIITDSLLSSFYGNKEVMFSFKNTPFYKEGGLSLLTEDFDGPLKKQESFFKKLDRSKVGITVVKPQELIEMTIGGYKEMNNSNGSATFGNSVSFLNSTFMVSHLTHSFFSYKHSRSIYFKSLLNGITYKHVEGEIKETGFDKIKVFMDKHYVEDDFETIYLHNGSYYLSYYVLSNETYYIIKF